MEATSPERSKQWARVVAKSWADADYKQRLIQDPAAVLAEEGVSIPAGITLRVVEDSARERTLVLPPPPQEEDTIQSLEERLAADSCCFCCCGSSCCP